MKKPRGSKKRDLFRSQRGAVERATAENSNSEWGMKQEDGEGKQDPNESGTS